MSLTDWCDCKCHRTAGHFWNPMGVDPRDRIGAVTACELCRDKKHHVNYAKDPVFRREKFDLPEPFQPPRPADATGTCDEEDDQN